MVNYKHESENSLVITIFPDPNCNECLSLYPSPSYLFSYNIWPGLLLMEYNQLSQAGTLAHHLHLPLGLLITHCSHPLQF